MAPTYTAPGVYLEELPGAPRSIEGVPTSVALFIGWVARGQLDAPVRVTSVADYAAHFGPPDARSDLGPSIAHFFANGGSDAWVVRLAADDATVAMGEGEAVRIAASSSGAWGNRVRVKLVKRRGRSTRFRLDVREGSARSPVVERFDDVSLAADDTRHAPTIVNAVSARIRIETTGDATGRAVTRSQALRLVGGSDGSVLVAGSEPFRAALLKCFEAGGTVDAIDRFNLLCVPGETSPATQALLQAACLARRAFYIADCAANATVDSLTKGPDPSLLGKGADCAALYAPWALATDAAQRGASPAAVRSYPPCGFVAGIYARIDAAHGVWKAPGGSNACLIGSAGLALAIDDGHNDLIGRAGINCLRHFAASGDVVWGSRTMAAAHGRNTDWKYVPVRRLALFIEASVADGLQWVVFEPNADALWEAVRRAVGNFLQDLWTLGAFAGSTARDAYFVHCDRTTMTQADIDTGRLNIEIGFAPTRPAEFVIIRIGLWAQCRECDA